MPRRQAGRVGKQSGLLTFNFYPQSDAEPNTEDEIKKFVLTVEQIAREFGG